MPESTGNPTAKVDIVEILRHVSEEGMFVIGWGDVCGDAADEIEKLRIKAAYRDDLLDHITRRLIESGYPTPKRVDNQAVVSDDANRP